MWPESQESARPLRTGLTTGTCATACVVAAGARLLQAQQPDRVQVHLPRGQVVELEVETQSLGQHSARASTIKDAGDDPDVTHGARIFVTLSRTPSDITFVADQGVGTVTREGLLLPVGEPAINPVPRQMIRQHLASLSAQAGYTSGFRVAIGIEQGEALAQKTMNPRLGILGGLSVLGTSGIVRPFSCSAWIASIYQGLDVAAANGIHHIAASTGNASEQAMRNHYQLPSMALIEMGDFAGALLKHLRQTPKLKLSLCAGFGKLIKLAQGHRDLHSRSSQIDFQQLSLTAAAAGAGTSLQAQIRRAPTALSALKQCQQQNIPIAQAICQQALVRAQHISHRMSGLEVWAVDRQGQLIGHAGGLA